MSYIVGIIVVALIFTALHYFTELTLKQKVASSVIFLVIVLGAIWYNSNSAAYSAHIRNVEIRYNQGKTLHCEGIDVNSSNFSYSVGTQTFIGKKESPYFDQMIRLERCR